MTLKKDWEEKCEELKINTETGGLLWEFIEERVGVTQEKLLADLSNERSVSSGLKRKVGRLADELAKLQSN